MGFGAGLWPARELRIVPEHGLLNRDGPTRRTANQNASEFTSQAQSRRNPPRLDQV